MSFVEDEHPRDGDGKFATKGGDQSKSTKVSLVKDDTTGKYYDKLDKQKEEIHGKDWEEFQDIFDKYPQLLKDSGGLPDTSKYNKDMVLELEFQSDEFWKDDEWKKRDEKLKKLEDNPPKVFADLKYEESDKLYDVKDDKDNDKKVDKIRDELRNKKYDNIRPISEWKYINADKVLRKLEKEYEKTGDSYVKDRIDQQKEYLDYHKKDAEVERRIYNHEKLKLKNMLSDQENEKQVRIIGINNITDELVMSYHNFMADKHEKLNQVKHDEKIEKLLKKNWNTIDDDGKKGIDDYRMTYFAYQMEYGRIINAYNDMKTQMREDGGYTRNVPVDPSVEEIKTLYNNIPKKVTDFMNAHSSTEKDYTDSIRLDAEDVKNDIKFNVVTPLMSEGYGISAVTDETRDYLYYPRKEAVESAVDLLTKRKNIDFWKGVTNNNFQTRLHGGKGSKFTVGNKTHREGGHWSKSANEIKIYNMSSYKKLDNILPHEFSHSQFEGVREYVKWSDSKTDLNNNTQEKIKEMYDMFVGEVENIKEGVESNDLSESIKKLPELEKDLELESGAFGGGKPEKIFTDYFMDYIRARDDEGVEDRRKANSVDTEMFACLSELKYSTKPEERKKLFMIKLAYPKLFKSYETMEGGIKGLPKDEITDKVEVGFNKVDDMRGVMNSVESKKKSYESIEYLNFNGEFVDEENAEVIWIKTYDSDDQLIGMKSYSIDLKEVTEEAYDETKHNRGGNTQNSGQFSKGSGGGSTQTYDTKKLKRQTKTPKPQFPSKPKKNLNVQISLRFKMVEEVSKHFKNIDTDKLLAEAEKSDNEWQSRENLGLQIDDDLAMKFQTSRVMHRTKDTFSSIEKLARKPESYNTVDDLNDRTGVRVISKDIREVRDAIKYIEENYEIIDEKNYLDDGHPTGSGYRSYHCIIKDKETGFEAEIQVRTENEDIWANVFHDLYKPHEAKMRKALDSNPEGVKKYANDYSNYLYNIDCCQVYGTVPDLPTELAQAGFSYSDEAEHDETNFFDAMMGEIYEMTPDYGFNVVIFDDYSPDGEKLTLIGNYDNEQDANTIKQQCEAQGKVTYIYKPDGTSESFEEEEHPRDGDGKFTSGGGKSPKEYEQTNKMHNDIENGSPIKLQSNLKDIVSSGKFDDKTKKALDSIIDNWGYIQEKIAKDKGCDVTRDGHFKAINPDTIKKNKIVGKPTNYMENVCASSSLILQKAFNSQGVKSNFVSGMYWGKGRAKNIDSLSGFTPPQDTADGGNVVTDELRSLGYDTFYPPNHHKWVTLEDGTIIDGSYGQFLNKVTDKHQRLQIITPDDPRNKWYVTTDKYLPDKNDLYLGGIESFVEDEHPRDGDGQFAKKGSSPRVSIIDKIIDVIEKNNISDIDEEYLIAPFSRTTDPDSSMQGIKKKWDELAKTNPEIKNLQNELEEYGENINNTVKKQYEETTSLYRGMRTDELDFYIETGRAEPYGYRFISFTMDKNIGMGFGKNAGVTVEFDKDNIKNQKLWNGMDMIIEPNNYDVYSNSVDAEKIGHQYPISFADELEVRSVQFNIENTIKSITLHQDKFYNGDDIQNDLEKYTKAFPNAKVSISSVGFTEAFVEDEHPRDGDGQFATKDGGDDTNKDFDTFKKELKEKIIPTAEENTKNAKVESSVINGINDYAKGKYDGKINFVETQGSFAKGTDLAGSSDLDIFVGFDYGVSVKDMEKIVLELGDNVLKPISDKGEYKIMNGADKKYPESYVDGVEVQIIGTTDVTLDQIKNGMNNKDKGITDGMKTATDRSPHHTRFMKEALKGKEEDVRMVKKFFKDAGVYDASVAKQGFSGFSTEVLVHNLGSFDKVLEFFADFKKGSVIGETSRKFKTPLVMVDPIDENRNLASAFSHGDEDSSTIPNKNLGRLIKTAQSVIKDGKMPEITSTEEDSITMDFNIDNSIERNEVYSQLYKYANSTAKQFDKNNFGVKVAKDNVTDDFTVDMPRIGVDYDDKTGKGSISFGLKEFDSNTQLVGGIKKEGLPQHIMDRFYAKHEGKNIVEKDNKLYAEYEGQTASDFLNDIVKRDGKHMTKSSKLDKFLMDSTITRGNKPFENLTDKPSVTESFEEDEHPRDGDGKFTSKDDGGLNSRVEQKQNVIRSQIDYLQKSMKPESQKYRAFQKVTDEDRSIRYNNKSLQEDIDKLKLEIDSPDTTGLPHLPLKQNTHAVQTIEGGMSWKEGENEPLEGFKKGNTAIDVNVPLKREGDDFGYNKVKADRQINTLKLMWNSLGDEERDIIKSFNIERTPKLIVETDEKTGGLIYVNMHDYATAGFWRPSKNQFNMRIDNDMGDDQLKGTFTHEIGHALWHSIVENHPDRIEAWKVACKKVPPTTKYGKYNKKNWTDMKKLFDKYEKEGWSEFPENERDEKRANAIKNVEFYEDRYYNELHSEVHMYMMGNNKYKRGVVTKGVEKFLEPYKALHGLV